MEIPAAVRQPPRGLAIAYACDAAISAVASDAGLVAELISGLNERLRFAANWQRPDDDGSARWLHAGESRMVVVLHSALWSHDAATTADAEALKARIRKRRSSVCVVSLDDTEVPRWLSTRPRYVLGGGSRAGMVDFVLDAVAASGGDIRPRAVEKTEPAAAFTWAGAAGRFLGQPRAHSALRSELETIAARFEEEIRRAETAEAAGPFEMRLLPNRLTARLGDRAVTVSWLTGRQSGVSDGQLLVIAWTGLAQHATGPAALSGATQMHERTYSVEATTPESWQWRAEGTQEPYSSASLAAEWIARIDLARTT